MVGRSGVGFGRAAISSDTGDWERWFNGLSFCSKHFGLNFFFCIQRKTGIFEYSDGLICRMRLLASVHAKHHLDLIFFLILKCRLSPQLYKKEDSFY